MNMQMGSLLAVAASLALAAVPASAFAVDAVVIGGAVPGKVATSAARTEGDCATRTAVGKVTSGRGSKLVPFAHRFIQMAAEGPPCFERVSDNPAPKAVVTTAVPLNLGSAAPEPAGWILIVAGVGMVGIGMRSRDQLRSQA